MFKVGATVSAFWWAHHHMHICPPGLYVCSLMMSSMMAMLQSAIDCFHCASTCFSTWWRWLMRRRSETGLKSRTRWLIYTFSVNHHHVCEHKKVTVYCLDYYSSQLAPRFSTWFNSHWSNASGLILCCSFMGGCVTSWPILDYVSRHSVSYYCHETLILHPPSTNKSGVTSCLGILATHSICLFPGVF